MASVQVHSPVWSSPPTHDELYPSPSSSSSSLMGAFAVPPQRTPQPLQVSLEIHHTRAPLSPLLPYQRPRSSSPANSASSVSSNHPPPILPAPAQRSAPVQRTARYRKHTKQRLTDLDKKNICIYHGDHPNARQEDIGLQFGVERSTISKILKEKHRWLNVTKRPEKLGKQRFCRNPDIEGELEDYLQRWTENGTQITDQLIRQTALEINERRQPTHVGFKASSGWLENFKKRSGIRGGIWLEADSYRLKTSTGPADGSHISNTPMHLRHPSPVPFEHPATHKWFQQLDDVRTQPVLDPVLDAPVVINSDHVPLHIHLPMELEGDHAIQHSPDPLSYWNSNFNVHERPPVPSVPTPAEAEHAVATLINYFKLPGISHQIKESDLTALHNIKYFIFQYASGLNQ